MASATKSLEGTPRGRSRRISRRIAMPQAAFDTHAETGKLKRAGWPEGQAEAMVDLVARAPLNPQLAQDMEWLKRRVKGNENRLQRVETRLLRMEDAMSGMATKVDLEVWCCAARPTPASKHYAPRCFAPSGFRAWHWPRSSSGWPARCWARPPDSCPRRRHLNPAGRVATDYARNRQSGRMRRS